MAPAVLIPPQSNGKVAGEHKNPETIELQGKQAGETGIEPATCGFGDRGGLSRSGPLRSDSRFVRLSTLPGVPFRSIQVQGSAAKIAAVPLVCECS